MAYLALRSEQAVSEDGFGCVRCPGGLSEEGTCLCPQGTVRGASL